MNYECSVGIEMNSHDQEVLLQGHPIFLFLYCKNHMHYSEQVEIHI